MAEIIIFLCALISISGEQPYYTKPGYVESDAPRWVIILIVVFLWIVIH